MNLTFELPAALGLLVVPALLLVFVRRARSPRPVATGTLPLWREAVDSSAPRGVRAERSWPPGLLLLCGALAAGVLALAGPRTGAPAARARRFVLDRSPSMFLAANAGGATRMELALERVRAHLDSVAGPADSVRWSTWNGSAFVEAEGREVPRSWLRRPAAAVPPPPWELVDGAGTTWVTDSLPVAERERAGVCASGGAEVPGPVAYYAGTETLWDGVQLVSRARVELRRVVLGAGLPAAVSDLVRIWAAARGLELVGDDEDPALTVAGARGAAVVEVRAGHEGWTASGPAALLATPATDLEPRRTWLATADGRAVVVWWPGHVSVAWSEPLALDGDRAAFAVSWSRLLERALLAPAQIVSFAERQAAGAAHWEPARLDARLERAGQRPWAPWLAGLACLLALAATRCEA